MGPLDGMSGMDGMSGADGMSGPVGMARKGSAGPAINTPLVAEALIRTRDGIVGTWQSPAALASPDVGLPENLMRWSPDMRAIVLEGEMLSRLAYSHDPSGSVFLWHVKADFNQSSAAQAWPMPPTVSYLPLVALTRPDKVVFNKQVALVHGYADLRPDRATEILAQLGDPFAFFGSVANLHALRTPWTLALLQLALRLSHLAAQRAKHMLACLRPSDLSPQIQPIIQVPGHSALPSGHSTEAFICATVLYQLMKSCNRADAGVGAQFMRLAARIAVNRTVAGVHFPVDSVAGAVLGLTLGKYLVARASKGKEYQAWRFDGASYPGQQDFDWKLHYDLTTEAQTPIESYVVQLPVQSDSGLGSPILNWLWEKARSELGGDPPQNS